MQGGAKGLLQNSNDLCKAGKKATVKMIGQNGKRDNRKTKLQTSCGSKASKYKRHRRHLRLDGSREVR